MIEVYGYVPAWGLPDISPYVTKLIFYLNIVKIPFKYHSQDLARLDIDSPYGKLPYIIDTDDGTKVGDSNLIIQYLQKKYGNSLDDDLTGTETAVCLAFDRMICEHLYWSGVIEPRWRMDEGFETYIPYLVQGAEVGPELRAFLDTFRVRIATAADGQGMGRRDNECVLKFYHADIDALAVFLADKKYFLGDKPHIIDATFYAMLRHLVDQPQKWKGTGYIETKKNLVGYLARMREDFGI
jgi:isoprene-epoxide---glutathione S-transferase